MKNQKIVKGLILCLIFVLSLSSLVFADEMGMTKGTVKKVDDLSVQLSFKNEKVKTGKNDIMVTIKDSNGAAVADAKVSAIAQMDKNMEMDMEKTKPTAIEFENGDEKGQYMGTIDFTNKGKWIIDTTLTVNGQEKKASFEVEVASDGPNWYIIGGFLGVISLIIIVAAIKKKQTVKA